jgi:hypothetical protein
MLAHENAQININILPFTKGVVRALSSIAALKDYEIISWFFVSSVLVSYLPIPGVILHLMLIKKKRDSQVIIRN